MSIKAEITKAVGAHGLWKGRLKTAISTGKSEFNPATVALDNACDFGKWLYGPTIPAADKATPNYKECKDLHAKFHKCASKVLTLALSGKKAEAEAASGPTSECGICTQDLTRAMMAWERVAK